MVVFVFGADAVGWWLDSFPVFGSSCRGGFSLGEPVEAFLRAGRFQVGGQFRALATALTQVRGRALEAVESLVGLVGANHFQVVGIAVYPGGVEVAERGEDPASGLATDVVGVPLGDVGAVPPDASPGLGDPLNGLRGGVEPAILTPLRPEGPFGVLGGLAGVGSASAGLPSVQQPRVLGVLLESVGGAAELVNLSDRPAQPGTVGGQLGGPRGVELGHRLLDRGQLGRILGGDSGRSLQKASDGRLPRGDLGLLGGDLGHPCEPLGIRHGHRFGRRRLLWLDGWDVGAVQGDQVPHAFTVGLGVQVSGPPAGISPGVAQDVLYQPAGQIRTCVGGDQGSLVDIPAAGGSHIERGPVHALIDQLHRLVHGQSLGSVPGHRIGQLQMFPGRPRCQLSGPPAVKADQPHPTVTADRLHAPALPGGDHGLQLAEQGGGEDGLGLDRLQLVVLAGDQVPVTGVVHIVGVQAAPHRPPGSGAQPWLAGPREARFAGEGAGEAFPGGRGWRVSRWSTASGK